MNNSSNNEGRNKLSGSKKPLNKEGKPFEKDRPFKKFEKTKDNSGKKSWDAQDKPFKKPFEKEGSRPYKKSFGDKEESSFKKPYPKEAKPFNRENNSSRKFEDRKEGGAKKSWDAQDKPFKKPFDKDSRPYKKSFGDKEESNFKKTYNKDAKPFDREHKPYKKFEDRKEGGTKKSWDAKDKPFKKPFDKDGGSRPYKKAFGAKDQPASKSKEERFVPKKKRFGKFEDDDLSFGKKKQIPVLKPEVKEEEVTFSKSIEKWEEEPVTPPYGKIEENLKKRDYANKPSKFQQRFDNEQPEEKAYSNVSRGKPKQNEDYFSPEALEGEMPLNKYIAHCGVCSRRDAVVLIKEGKVKVNGELVVEPAHKVTLEDKVTLSGKKLTVQKNLIYILLNKPKGFITTTDDPKGRRTVMDIFENQIEERIFPIGRLDRNTTGLLLLTNDGELTQKLSHPKYEIKKVYQVTLDKDITLEDFDKIKEGVILEDGPAPVDKLEFLDSKNELGLEIHSGKNRIVRRIFESLGYQVEKLDRVMYAGLTKKNVVRGKWRFLSKQEVINLKHIH